MKILSWNVNGLRAVYHRNFLEWTKRSKADILCLQEIKAQKEDLPQELINFKGYISYFNFATKKGYSGVAIYSRIPATLINYNLGIRRFDREGRFLELSYPQFTLINLYLPHGGRKKENLSYKLRVYGTLLKYLRRKKDQTLILIGDFNIAHQEIDLARPKANKNNIMFTPKERIQIDNIISVGFCDTFRKFHQEGGWYTWWPYYAKARERNLGWRIDYCFVSESLCSKIKDAFIDSKTRGSDHCPIGIEF